VGLSPCLPLLGILNYIIITSSSPLEAVLFTLVFGVGTILSPLILVVVLSARLGKWFSENEKFKRVLKIICGLVLVLLGSKIILQRLLP
jgi:threonine/homoserine/homoserine lactone efflux protein